MHRNILALSWGNFLQLLDICLQWPHTRYLSRALSWKISCIFPSLLNNSHFFIRLCISPPQCYRKTKSRGNQNIFQVLQSKSGEKAGREQRRWPPRREPSEKHQTHCDWKIPLLLSFVSSDFTLYSLRSSSPASCSFTAHTKGPPCTMEQQLKSWRQLPPQTDKCKRTAALQSVTFKQDSSLDFKVLPLHHPPLSTVLLAATRRGRAMINATKISLSMCPTSGLIPAI